ncbi:MULTISPECIES: hypothetical protein [Pseudomonas]|uniref:Uncharacterized protein n=1 Tax=Pseudomonas fluorescens TaxID=294 RepID=A0A166QMT9_PSEFL|nr:MULTISPECIES: hypothetical protein [Pseudomonas]KZN20549.1 hypothetical protein A1D17_03130 [Pseudomonas fluorescens]
MGWYCHPDTIAMASANGLARKVAGETGTLAYLRAYRDEYAKEVARNPMQGGVQYLASLEAAILIWELGDFPDFTECPVPGMVGITATTKPPIE